MKSHRYRISASEDLTATGSHFHGSQCHGVSSSQDLIVMDLTVMGSHHHRISVMGSHRHRISIMGLTVMGSDRHMICHGV